MSTTLSLVQQPAAEFIAPPPSRLDVERLRQDFPVLQQEVYPGKPLVFLDSAASAQKPRQVIDAMADFMRQDYANVHRGVHALSQRSSEAYEQARARVAGFLNAPENGIVFTRSTTEAINLVAQSWAGENLNAGDAMLITELEHHANIVPWQLAAQRTGFEIRIARIHDDGSLDIEDWRRKLPGCKLVAMAQVSNVLGTRLPVEDCIAEAQAVGARVLLDATQAAVHEPLDVAALGVDFLTLTGHKLYGPTGIGVLYGKPEVLDAMPPYQGGGDMIETVTFSGSTYRAAPYRFEAGTPAIVEAVGLAAAIDWLEGWGLEPIAAHEAELLSVAQALLAEIPGLTIHGTAPGKVAVLSFTLKGAHPHDIGTILDREGIAVRVGQHCAEPLMNRLGVSATVRASFAAYNTLAEAEALAAALTRVQEIFG